MYKGKIKFILGCVIAAVAILWPDGTIGQTRVVLPPDAPVFITDKEPPPVPVLQHLGGDTYEKAISVASKVAVDLCVVQGTLRISGWKRDEVRVFVKDGSRVGFNVREKSSKDGKPVWISVIGYDEKKQNKGFPDCVWGSDIEIDVPENATVEIKGQEVGASIDKLRKLWIKNVGGNISVRNVSSGITALTYEGDITVDASEGPMILETSTGNITAFEVSPGEIGDRFKAKTTGGAIVLERVTHRQTEANSISGSVSFNGEIRPGGSYILSTSNGSIRLTLPKSTSCQTVAQYGYGTFSSELPIKLETETIEPGPLKKVSGKIGTGGDALLKLTTNHGSISIKKSEN
ncbi:MAG: DUF4097 family beta strand repeat-containing protein [Pyrinomonadaceae bacterium]